MRRKIAYIIKGILERDVRMHASSIAFFFFMSLIPLLILLASVVPFFGIDSGDVNRFFQSVMPADSNGFVYSIIREAFSHSGAAFSISALMLLWTASRGVSALTEGLNSMYDQKEGRKFARLTLMSFGYTLALMVFMTAVIYLIFSGRLLSILRNAFPGIDLPSGTTTFLEFLLLLVVGILFFCLVYRALPSGRRSILLQFPGAFLASAGWVLFSMGFRVYVNVFNSFARFYGSLATVIVLLFWFYWIFYILLIGGYLNAHIEEIVPGRFVRFFNEEKRLGMAVCGLFLAGFMAFLSDSFLSWKLYLIPHIRMLMILLRIVTIASWLIATVISARKISASVTKKEMVFLILLLAGDFLFLQRRLFSNAFIYLVVFMLWNLLILCLCAKIIFSEKGQ